MKKALVGLLTAFAGLCIAGAILYASNSAPVVARLSPADPAVAAKPYVVKLHAKWCPTCMMTKGIWSDLEKKYAGRVNFVVFDFTNQATSDESRAEAKRVGLEKFFEEFGGTPGAIFVLDTGTKNVRADISGSRDLAEYSAAIDAALAAR